ncbi:IS66 family transposase [Acetobacterium paludosum]|nr:IS66 family transposase [Acetobacterium paludosum]
MTQALTYSRNQKKYLETFLEDGRLPISNNLCLSSLLENPQDWMNAA